jgi:enoyl-CoA hydratase
MRRAGAVAVVTMNRPEVRNAMNAAMYAQCIAALNACLHDARVRCVVLTGAGSCFSSGRDLKERDRSRQRAEDYLEHTLFSEEGPAYLYSYMAQYRKPLITAINGPAVAGGFIVAVLGDISIASDRAFFALPEIDRGIPPPGGVMAFPNLVSRAKGVYLLLTGERIDATEAERIGLISKVVPHDRFLDETLRVANVVASKSATAARLLKTSLLASGWGDDLKMNIAREAIRAIGDITPDRVAGIGAYARGETRKPARKAKVRRAA